MSEQLAVNLKNNLAQTLKGMALDSIKFGLPDLIEKEISNIQNIFSSVSISSIDKNKSYQAALKFLRNEHLSSWDKHLISSILCEPISEADNQLLINNLNLDELLKYYKNEIQRNKLWRLTWYGLLISYFSINLENLKLSSHKKGWEKLRLFLYETWPLIDQQNNNNYTPDWINVLKKNTSILSINATQSFSLNYLDGHTTHIDSISTSLGIPAISWFWEDLLLSAVKAACDQNDQVFQTYIPTLIDLIKDKPVFRDDAIATILIRYNNIKNFTVNEKLRDYVIHTSVWKNPKLKSAGLASKWNRVPENVWQMVLGWVNKQNLRDFFDILASRSMADEGRLDFWSDYMEQITWTRLAFGAETMRLQRTNTKIKNLIAREEGAYAELTKNDEIDAFIMKIGEFYIIEFSKQPNAAYIYPEKDNRLNLDSRYYEGDGSDLKYGKNHKNVTRIIHRLDWQSEARRILREHNIKPDVEHLHLTNRLDKPISQDLKGNNTSFISDKKIKYQNPLYVINDKQNISNKPDKQFLDKLLLSYPQATMKDLRGDKGGRLWITDPHKNSELEKILTQLGFRWAASRAAWYLPEN